VAVVAVAMMMTVLYCGDGVARMIPVGRGGFPLCCETQCGTVLAPTGTFPQQCDFVSIKSDFSGVGGV